MGTRRLSPQSHKACFHFVSTHAQLTFDMITFPVEQMPDQVSLHEHALA